MKPHLLILTLATATILPLSASAQDAVSPTPPASSEKAAPKEGGPDRVDRPGRRGGPDGPRGPRGPRDHRGPRGGGAALDRIGERVGFSDTQKDQIRDILKEAKPTLGPLFASVNNERKALHDATDATPADENAIRAQATKLATAEGNLAVEKSKVFGKIHAVLTPEQVEKLKDLHNVSDQLLRGAINRVDGPDERERSQRRERFEERRKEMRERRNARDAGSSKAPAADAEDDAGDE